MNMDKRVLYNILRMNWLRDPTIRVEPWQVADYRNFPLQTLFDNLSDKKIDLDRISFLGLAENVDTPEELTDLLISEIESEGVNQDQIYLNVFEIWRRLVTEKLCLSIFCNEIDYQIDLYYSDQEINSEELQDIIANLAVILDENTDVGGTPREIFDSISSRCANDLESFLYDYIAEQIDDANEAYAIELLDDFGYYVKEVKWFEFLKARLIAISDQENANLIVRKLLMEHPEPDLEFYLEVLAFLVLAGNSELFIKLVQQIMPLLTTEEEFQDLLLSCADYLHRSDYDHKEFAVKEILKNRADFPLTQTINPNHPHYKQLLNILI